MNKNTIFLLAALTAMSVVACSNDDDDNTLSNENNPKTELELTRVETEMVSGQNDFAFNLFRKVNEQPTFNAKSQILSPLSIAYALGMLANGASGETLQQITSTLGYGDNGLDDINSFCKKMLTTAPSIDKLTKVMIANTIFVNKGFNLKAGFLKSANDYYQATPTQLDFSEKTKSAEVINQWASDHTEKMITHVLDETSPNCVSYLLNAIYFKGAWAEKFDKNDTRNEKFFNGKEVPMMHQKNLFRYTEDDDCQVLVLPYGNGAYEMTVLLPKRNKSLDEIIGSMDADRWKKYAQYTHSRDVDVKLPRFESSTDTGDDLPDIMKALGMPLAFSDLAEFPNFCELSTYISMMKQVARIKLNEEGTEAAAVTIIGMELASAEPQMPVSFYADRPFMYAISETSTGSIFFIGKYMGD